MLCRDPNSEADEPQNYSTACSPWTVDQQVKAMIIYEHYGLNDIAVDLAARFADQLARDLTLITEFDSSSIHLADRTMQYMLSEIETLLDEF